jgi:hypothetical protein
LLQSHQRSSGLFACMSKENAIMDVLVIDCPTQWGMLLSRKWVADAGGSIQMDLSYADIPISQVEKVRLYREHKMLHMLRTHIRDNDPLYPDLQDPDAQETDLGHIYAYRYS